MKVLLVKPSFHFRDGRLHKANPLMVGLTLPYLAALLKGHDVRLVFEQMEDVNFEAEADLVMISSSSTESKRANEISDEFRKRGKPVILGGYYPSITPDLAEKHCDSIAIGDAEDIIDEILGDFQKGSLKRRYVSPNEYDLTRMPMPRFDLVRAPENHKFGLWPIQATRGCTRGCDFCSMNMLYGRRLRKRPIDEVVEEIRARGKLNYFFVDDNPMLNRKYFKDILRSIPDLVHSISCQVDPTVAEDDELFELSRKARMRFMFVGFETINKDAIRDVKKFTGYENYLSFIRKARKHSILVGASVMLGFDTDTRETFGEIFEFLETNKVPLLFLWILTPLIGSEFHKRLKQEGRLLYGDEFEQVPEAAMGTRLAFKPKNMTVEELETGFWDLFERFYSWKSILKRIVLAPYKSPKRTLQILLINIFARGVVRKRIHPNLV